MQILKQIGHQGDTQWFSIDCIPANLPKVKQQFIAASEQSGSFHALMGNYEQYEVKDQLKGELLNLPKNHPEYNTKVDGFCVDVKEKCILNHSLKEHLKDIPLSTAIEIPKKEHRHSVLDKGLYFVGIQQKHDPLSGLKINTVD